MFRQFGDMTSKSNGSRVALSHRLLSLLFTPTATLLLYRRQPTTKRNFAVSFLLASCSSRYGVADPRYNSAALWRLDLRCSLPVTLPLHFRSTKVQL